MSVIINDFEVVSDPPPPTDTSADTVAARSAPPPTPMLEELDRILRHHAARRARVAAD